MSLVNLFEIDLRNVVKSISDNDFIGREINEFGFYGNGFGYSAFNPRLKENILKFGVPSVDSVYGDYTFLCLVDGPHTFFGKGIRDDDDNDLMHYVNLNSNLGKGMFAIYDKSKFVEHKEMICHPRYEFSEPDKKLDALLGVVEVSL